MSKSISIEEILKAGLHFGHRTSRWHPKMKPFIYGSKNDLHIIDASQTKERLDQALNYISKLIGENKTLLFVGTKEQVNKLMNETAQAVNMPFVNEKWMGGTLTNFAIIKKSINKYKSLLEQKETGKLKKYTKKEQIDFEKEIISLSRKVSGLVSLNKLPDALFVWDIKFEATAVKEAIKMKIPIIGVCDTNSNPTGINFVIPANDDATKGLTLILNAVKETILENKKS